MSDWPHIQPHVLDRMAQEIYTRGPKPISDLHLVSDGTQQIKKQNETPVKPTQPEGLKA